MTTQDNGFNQFWAAYPKKVGKDAALKAWNKKKPDIDDVLSALSWQRESAQWKKEGGQFIPNPSTYINQGRWQDEPLKPETPSIQIKNKGHIMTDDQFTNWLTGDINGQLT